ncbi:hypothetical protein Tco_0114018 [Tanacetum coccineum]
MILSQEDLGTRLEPRIHKENPEEIADDNDDDENDDDDHNDHALIMTKRMGSLEVRNVQMQTSILSPPRSVRIDLSLDKAPIEEFTDKYVPMNDVVTPPKMCHSGNMSGGRYFIIQQLKIQENDL